MKLLDGFDAPIATTVTDDNGNYLFSGLPDGDYTVVVNDTDNVLAELDNTDDRTATRRPMNRW